MVRKGIRTGLVVQDRFGRASANLHSDAPQLGRTVAVRLSPEHVVLDTARIIAISVLQNLGQRPAVGLLDTKDRHGPECGHNALNRISAVGA